MVQNDYLDDDYCPSINDMAKALKANLEWFGMSGLPTGVAGLDDANILAPGNLVVLGGMQYLGRTAFIYMMMKAQIRQDIAVGYFTTENLNHPVAWTRLIGSVCDDVEVSFYSKDCYTNALQEIPEMPLYIHATPTLNIQTIKKMAHLLVDDYDVKVIYIDNILSVALAEDAPTSHCIKKVCLELKALAYELRIPIVVTSDYDMTKINQRGGAEGSRPRASDLKGCDYIQDIADVLLFLYKPDYYHILQDSDGNDMRGKIIATIEKNTYDCYRSITLDFLSGKITTTPLSPTPYTREQAESIINSSESLSYMADKLNLEVNQ